MSQEKLDARIDDLYREKLNRLPNGINDGSELQNINGYYTWNALDSIRSYYWVAIGRAIRDNNAEEAGRLVITAVCEVLRDEACMEAEEEIDNG